MRRPLLALLFSLATLPAFGQPASDGTLVIDPAHAKVDLKTPGSSGQFALVEGVIQYNGAHPVLSSVSFSLDSTSLSDPGLRKALDSKNYPEIRILSAKIKDTGGDTAQMIADTAIRNITKPVSLRVRYTRLSANRLDFHAEGVLHPGDFKIASAGHGNIALVIDAQFQRPASDSAP